MDNIIKEQKKQKRYASIFTINNKKEWIDEILASQVLDCLIHTGVCTCHQSAPTILNIKESTEPDAKGEILGEGNAVITFFGYDVKLWFSYSKRPIQFRYDPNINIHSYVVHQVCFLNEVKEVWDDEQFQHKYIDVLNPV